MLAHTCIHKVIDKNVKNTEWKKILLVKMFLTSEYIIKCKFKGFFGCSLRETSIVDCLISFFTLFFSVGYDSGIKQGHLDVKSACLHFTEIRISKLLKKCSSH